MTFTSIPFLLFFFIIFVTNYYITNDKKSVFLLLISYLFYGFFDVRFLPFLWVVTLLTYLSTKLIIIYPIAKKTWMILDIIFVLGILFYFKYINFFASLFGIDKSMNIGFLLPIGISFFTFQSLGYVIDVYRDKNCYEMSLINTALFIGFFPQITSGPISRSKDLIPQIRAIKRANSTEMESGLYQFLWGFFKKVVIADNFAIVANLGFNNYITLYGLPLLISVMAYTIQIYGDFSGYSDMAIGLSKMLGFKIKNNFDSPYFSTSIKEFWSRWHISLSTWFRDYVYIPLGGSRVTPVRKYFNILITFMVSGLWHGANLTFVLWGGLHGFFQIVEDLIQNKLRFVKLPKIVNWIITMSLVSFAWIFFRSENIDQAYTIISNILQFTLPTTVVGLSNMLSTIGIFRFEGYVMLSSLSLLVFVEFLNHLGSFYFYQESRICSKTFVLGAGLILVIIFFGAFSNPSFIYFNF